MKAYNILIEHPMTQNQSFTYQSKWPLSVGQRVLVPLKNQQVVGFVMSQADVTADFELKQVIQLIDEKPIINQELFELGKWLSWQTVSPLIRCYQTILPNQYRPKSSFTKVGKVLVIEPNKAFEGVLKANQQVVLDVITNQLTYKQAKQKYGATIDTLVKKGALKKFSVEKQYQEKQILPSYPEMILLPNQQQALDKIDFNQFQVSLLYGQTGSGKTEVYLQAGKRVLENKKQVLILVPEISLTPQMIERFQKRFGQDIGIYHSALNNQEKYEQYQRVANNKVDIVVGTRSSIFLPFSNLGLIVIDEEHDTSFKQENTPYYHTREVAIWRARYFDCPLVLGSATPSLETYAKAIKGVYQLLELKQRINLTPPNIQVVDMSKHLKKLQYQLLSDPLIEAMSDTLANHQQVMLLLNRRAYSPIVICEKCLNALMCPNCDVTLAYHQQSNSYKCHVCDYETKQGQCPTCHHQAHLLKGYGTQRLEEIVKTKFPAAKVQRMDADSTQAKNAHHKILASFNQHEIDILIGTQMIAKGLDNPNVTLVGIVDADQGLIHSDFYSCEKTFSLIMQAAGRSGRGQYPGRVILQTKMPSHYVIQYAITQNYFGFFKQEMNYRHKGKYPPYQYLAEICLTHSNAEKAEKAALECINQLQDSHISYLGPAALRKIANRYTQRIVLKSTQLDALINQCHKLDLSKMPAVQVSFNINPMELKI